LLDKDIAFNVEHLRNLIDFLEMKIVSAAKNISDKQNLEHQRPEDSDSEQGAELHCLEGYLELLSGTTFKMALKLNHADRLEIFQRVLFFLMTLAFFDCSDLKVPQTKSKKKKNKKSGALERVVIHTAVQKQLKVDDFDRRIRAGEVIGKILLMTVPELSIDDENWDTLTIIITKFSNFISESLQAGRRNTRTSTLFESSTVSGSNAATTPKLIAPRTKSLTSF
jgi:hypothetical protein